MHTSDDKQARIIRFIRFPGSFKYTIRCVNVSSSWHKVKIKTTFIIQHDRVKINNIHISIVFCAAQFKQFRAELMLLKNTIAMTVCHSSRHSHSNSL